MSKDNLFKTEPKTILGTAIPFFDRFADEDPHSKWDQNYQAFLGYDELLASVINEVSHILNTRRSARQAFYDDVEDDAIYFGLPALFGFNDFQSFDALNTLDRRKIINLCEKSINLFEPRLKNTKVTISDYDSQKQSLDIFVSGALQLKHGFEMINFPVRIDRKDR
ncbi:MAG: type VI secretion system baseplate subunit TssE [Candidatus Paracaedibacteraceae bacterium]|nr:type VI secretion system baseplate subunit TssE [Candidatus Paracaedibacteraceae bacterium]